MSTSSNFIQRKERKLVISKDNSWLNKNANLNLDLECDLCYNQIHFHEKTKALSTTILKQQHEKIDSLFHLIKVESNNMFFAFKFSHSQMLKHNKDCHQSNSRRIKSTSLFRTPPSDAHAENGIRQRHFLQILLKNILNMNVREKNGNIF